MADYIISGEGEESLYNLCKDLLEGNCSQPRTIISSKVDFEKIVLPFMMIIQILI